MHIGLIGGIGPAATDFYYRRLIAKAAKANHALELTIAHADAPTLLENLAAGHEQAQSDIYLRLTQQLQQAGAENVVVSSIAGHFCIDIFKRHAPLPVLDLIDAVNAHIAETDTNSIGLLGTGTVMANAMYGKLRGTDVITPFADDIPKLHAAYAELAVSGIATEQLRATLQEAAESLLDRGAQVIALGGTDLNLVFDDPYGPIPLLDCAAVHVDAIVAHSF